MSGLAMLDGTGASKDAPAPRAIRDSQPPDEDAMRASTWATIIAGHEAIEIVVSNREPLNRNQARQLLRTGKRLSNALAVLQPLSRGSGIWLGWR